MTPLRAAALAAALIVTAHPAVAQVGRFAVSTSGQGLTGAGDSDQRSNTGLTPLQARTLVTSEDSRPGPDLFPISTRNSRSEATARADAKILEVGALSNAYASVFDGAGSYGTGTIVTQAWSDLTLPFRIDAPGLQGTRGTMRATVTIVGEQTAIVPGLVLDPGASGFYESYFSTSAQVIDAPTSRCSSAYTACQTVQFANGAFRGSGSPIARSYDIEVGFRYGSWTSVLFSLGARVGASANASSPTPAAGFDSTEWGANSWSRLTWGGIDDVVDASNTAVAGWSVQSLPGVDLLTPVPEPAAWALWLAGLAAVTTVARRRATGIRIDDRGRASTQSLA